MWRKKKKGQHAAGYVRLRNTDLSRGDNEEYKPTSKTAVIDKQNNRIKYTEAYCALEMYVLFPDTYKYKLASRARVKTDLCKNTVNLVNNLNVQHIMLTCRPNVFLFSSFFLFCFVLLLLLLFFSSCRTASCLNTSYSK